MGRSSPVSDFEVAGTTRLRPTPDILDALEKDYPLEASVADLVDNSIDAGARRVRIRFTRRAGRLLSLSVVDDGKGMGASQINRAMQFAARRHYSKRDLGMFGVGMKTASLSHADTLTVLSRRRGGPCVGRQWTKRGIKLADWTANILTTRSAQRLYTMANRGWRMPRSGTAVRWDEVADFGRLREGVDAYIQRALVRLQNHLGLKLHRFLEKEWLTIVIDVEDLDLEEIGPPTEVHPLNPFPPEGRSGAPGYPKTLIARLGGGRTLELHAHIWRKKSKDDGYRLGGGRVAEHQGFYFYRHDRLIQDGGWNELIGTNEPHLSLARIGVDIPDRLGTYLKVRSNKAGVDVPPTFIDAVLKSTTRDGTTFREYVDTARTVYRTRGELKPRAMLKPGDGIPAEVRRALEIAAVPFLRGGACAVLWGEVPDGGFITIDSASRTVYLNAEYRRLLLRGARGGKTDLPLVRTLLYFVFEATLAGERLGKVERLRTQAIKAAMEAAMRMERKWVEE